MKPINIILLSLIFVTFLSAQGQEDIRLDIVYPKNNMTINAPSTFIVGNTDPKASLKINGGNVKVFPNGGFTQVIKLKRGENKIELKSSLNDREKKLTYTLNVPEFEKTISGSALDIDISSIKPDSNLLIKPGDNICVKFKGTTRNKASFSIGNIKDIPMIELPAEYTKTESIFGKIFETSKKPVKGVYTGTYITQNRDNFKNLPIIVKLSSANRNITRITNAKVLTFNNLSTPIVAEVKKDNTTVRTAPNKSRLTPLSAGTKINITGKVGDNYRFEMGEAMEGWILASTIKMLPNGTPAPKSCVSSISIESTTDEVLIKIPLSDKLPFLIQELPGPKIILTLYGAIAALDIFKYDQSDSFINEIKWNQPYKDTVQLYIVPSSKQLWGYDYCYEGNTLILKLRKPPVIESNNPLKDKIIAIDPGHGDKELGAVGPTRIPEKTINLSIANNLKGILESKGAKVVMTRTLDDFNPNLSQRVDLANYKNAQVLLSIHNNSLPDGVDPFKEHGSSTYYYNSQALPLARSIQNSLVNNLSMNNYGVFWDSLALTRPTKPLAVLVEVGFMINPEEYIRLTDQDFQKKAANSIYLGLENFFRSQTNISQSNIKQN
ncbi:MAG: N-acetylmuramoyl-L-alanine amidase [Candidatus Gastranaerophilales bacterium]|nr:N-acetylmuramoyl-L-alanine amidase [Candidatus Gastranaerophilales bacterium]